MRIKTLCYDIKLYHKTSYMGENDFDNIDLSKNELDRIIPYSFSLMEDEDANFTKVKDATRLITYILKSKSKIALLKCKEILVDHQILLDNVIKLRDKDKIDAIIITDRKGIPKEYWLINDNNIEKISDELIKSKNEK